MNKEQWRSGDIVSRTGTDEQIIKDINHDWGTLTVVVIKPDEGGNTFFKIGDEEFNLIRRYSFVRHKEEKL